MPGISNRAIDLIDVGVSGRSPAEVGRRFFGALQPFGAKAIFARAYAVRHAGRPAQVYSRISPSGWESFADQERFRGANFVVREMRRRASPFLWCEVEKQSALEREMEQFTIDEGYGPRGYVGLVSIAFEAFRQLAPSDRTAIQLASLVLHDRMRSLAEPFTAEIRLTSREVECLSYVADGLTDPEIADALGLTDRTIAFHMINARKKLGARTRSQAVARFVLLSY